jgi:hypothetical protein
MDETYLAPGGTGTATQTDCAVSPVDATVAPDSSACWAGGWARVDVRTQIWGQSAVIRTVGALPATHPWRLGGTSGAVRLVQWTGRPATVPEGVLCVLSVTAKDPQIEAGDDVVQLTAQAGVDVASDAVAAVAHRLAIGAEQRWAGALVRMPGSWLPAAAILPRGVPGVPSPRTHWATESVDFDDRYVVHSDDEQCTAALLSPSVMAVLLDAVPRGSAVTISGDALQIWWPYDERTRVDMGRVQRAALAALLLVKTFPRFVLMDHPDRSAEVERSLARKADEAHSYHEHLTYGRSPDPVLQRIYDQARAGIGVGPAVISS